MRKRFANKFGNTQHKYFQKRVDEEYFKGYVCYLKIYKVNNPLIIENEAENICILNNNYEWIELYPDDENYAITIMYDDKGKLIEWYFDIAKEVGIENGIPYEDDLYLDVVITSDGELLIIDKEELQEALDNKKITNDDFKLAYEVAEKIKQKYGNNLEELTELTNIIYADITKDVKNIEEGDIEI